MAQDGFIEQGALRMADEVDAARIQPGMPQSIPHGLYLSHTQGPELGAALHRCAVAQLDHQQVCVLQKCVDTYGVGG
ncbi:hypothetical protein D3C80_1751640 [compost metagenome]